MWWILALACGDDASGPATGPGSTTDPGTDGPTGSAEGGLCSDPAVNPFLGTCIETFLADCFVPTGECTTTESGLSFTFTWENGASMSFDLLSVEISGESGVCATGTVDMGGGDCVSRTTYTRTTDGATQVWCMHADGSATVTCDDDSATTYTSAEFAAGGACGFASGDAGTCDPPALGF